MPDTAPKDKALREKGLAALCAHIKEVRAAAQNSGGAVADLAELLDKSLQEIEDALNDLPKSTPVTIPTTGWASDSTTGYPNYYDITVAGVTANDRAEITIAPDSIGTAISCGLCPTNETMAGKIRVRAANIPKADIMAEYWIENGKAE